jgi:toxin-antitoxin system PIN domain toxin
LLDGAEPVALPWAVAIGFVRLMTHRSVLVTPMSPEAAIAAVRAWFACPQVEALSPGPRHLEVLDRLLAAAAGKPTTDAHLAALAIEHPCELGSNDADVARFPGLRWHDPL